MVDGEQAGSEHTHEVTRLVATAVQLAQVTPDDALEESTGQIGVLLDAVERATPGGAPLHAQIDTVRKWLRVLRDRGSHARFGGTAHIRGYLVTQLRLTGGALEDYLREMS